MKALTLWQPWASAIGAGLKQYETRGWQTHYRGPLIIHAAKKSMGKNEKQLAQKYGLTFLPQGGVVAVCDLTDCFLITKHLINQLSPTELDFGIWTPGRYAWRLENIRPITTGRPIRGFQGLWNCPLYE